MPVTQLEAGAPLDAVAPKVTPLATDTRLDGAPSRAFKPSLPIPGAEDIIPPVVNFLDYPIRDLSARIVAAFKGGLPTDDASRKAFYKEYEKSLPFAAIPETPLGQKISKVASWPGQMVGAGIEDASNRLLGKQTTKELAPYAGAAADLLPYAGAKIGASRAVPASTATAAERVAAQLQNRARSSVNRAFETGAKGGGPTALDAIHQMQEARSESQPFALTDIDNPELRSLVGTVYRKGGAARAVLDDFFKGRNVAQIDRVRGLVERHLSDESLRETAAQLAGQRSANARPLWDEAMAGGSLAPLETQFETAFNEAGRREAQATRTVEQLQSGVTGSTARQSQAGNVYSSAAANLDRRGRESQLAQAQQELTAARAEKSAMRERLVRAQADGTSNAPGAVWSPRLQQLLDMPEVERGIRHGYAMERRFATGEGRPFNPHEYAVLGLDDAGNPIVGQVPNMKLLAVAKEGLDAIIGDMQKERRFGRPTKDELSYIELRNGLMSEVDRLNPAYKAARDQWSGDTASMRALEEGRQALDVGRNARFRTPEDIAEHARSLSPNDREFFVLGVSDKLQERLRGAIDTTDKSRIIKNEETRLRLRPMFASDAEADQFLSAMEREHTMRQTSNKLTGGSQTAERSADDRRAEGLIAGAHALAHSLTGNQLAAVASALRTRRLFGGRPNPALNEAIARLVADPTLNLSGTGDLLSGVPVPPRTPRIGPVGGALSGEAVEPRR